MNWTDTPLICPLMNDWWRPDGNPFQPLFFLNIIDYCGASVKRHNYSQSDFLLKEYLYSYSKADNGFFQDNLLNSFVKKNVIPTGRNNVTELGSHCHMFCLAKLSRCFHPLYLQIPHTKNVMWPQRLITRLKKSLCPSFTTMYLIYCGQFSFHSKRNAIL